MPWTEIAGSAASWGAVRGAATAWVEPAGVSASTRLNPVFPQTEGVGGDFTFIYRVQSEKAWYVATGNGVLIVSSITGQTP